LFVQEYPSFEYRFLKSLLERGLKREASQGEKAFELDALLQEADGQYVTIDETATRSFPVDREGLFQYDVIIFGDVNPTFFSDSLLRNLADFVRERGGGLIINSGPRHTPHAYRGTPLAEILPIHLESTWPRPWPSRFRLTFLRASDSRRADDADAQISEDPTAIEASMARLSAAVLARSRAPLRREPECSWKAWRRRIEVRNPSFACNSWGPEKSFFHLTDETYRWAKHPDGDQFYARYWLQTIRYLSRSKLLGTNRNVEISSDQEPISR
jgi:hypothetical protein